MLGFLQHEALLPRDNFFWSSGQVSGVLCLRCVLQTARGMARLLLFYLLLATGFNAAEGFAAPLMALKLPTNSPPVVICPGFGNDARDYTNPLDGGVEGAFSAALQRRGLDTFVVPVERSDWLNLASAILTLDFWKGTCRPDGPAYSWYLDKVKETVSACLAETGADKVVLVGHSAGGWLARAALADGQWEDGVASEDVVAGLVTLGTPHFAGPMDMTRGALTFTSDEYPGAYLKDRGVFYVTVGGTAVEGDKDAPRNSRARFAYGSYKTVCGEGATTGDACVPLIYAHLEGAEQVTLDGVFHSVDKPNDWYGAEEIVDRWLPTVVQELRPSTIRSGGGAAISELFSGKFANLFK